MRKSKTRKTDKKLKAKRLPQLLKEVKAKKRAIKAKLEAWRNLPPEQWTEARKVRNGVTGDVKEAS